MFAKYIMDHLIDDDPLADVSGKCPDNNGAKYNNKPWCNRYDPNNCE